MKLLPLLVLFVLIGCGLPAAASLPTERQLPTAVILRPTNAARVPPVADVAVASIPADMPVATAVAPAAPTPQAAAPAAPTPTLDTGSLILVPSGGPAPTAATAVAPRSTPAPAPPVLVDQPIAYSYPIGWPGQAPGDGFFIRHGYTVENTWYNPGFWHTGEDWYAINNGETAGAEVYAIADGVVVYTDGNYPGRVVIVKHADQLFSMYGHLDFALAVAVGQPVARGDLLGMVLRRGDVVPNHLHFEVRTFLTTPPVNGDTPRYNFRCGINCPPGPGYWPGNAPDLPSQLGWRNPTHVIAQRAWGQNSGGPIGAVMVPSQPADVRATLWSAPGGDSTAQALAELSLQGGDRYRLLGVWTGPEESQTPSAVGYQVWYQIAVSATQNGWVQATVPSSFETGSNGQPSTVSFNFIPAISPIP